MDNARLAITLEAILFYKAEPISVESLSKLLNLPKDEVQDALRALGQSLTGRGIQLIQKDGAVALATASEAAAIIERTRKEELSRDLGKAASETLAIILYRAPITRSEIDYIRGVNSTFMLRALLVRGLIERVMNPTDRRTYLYRPTLELLGHLGITSIEELPEFDTVKREIEAIEQELAEEINEE